MVREEVKKIIGKSIENLYKQEIEVFVERPENTAFGDYSTNAAMVLKKNPEEMAEVIKSSIFEKVEAKNGFVNFFLSKKYLEKQVELILKQKEKFGEIKQKKRQKVNVEFISANPTGPLTLGNGRGGFCGDVFSNILAKAGFKVEREYYINDTGEQVKKLGHSLLGDSQAVYRGKYIESLRKKIKGKDAQEIGEKAAKAIMEETIKPTTDKMGINFDNWFSEKSLYQKKEVDKILDFFKKKNFSYEKDGALWFKSNEFGDDKDRVLIKENGESTYFLSDAAYLKNKIKRGFKKLFFFWGADHFGYINRIKAVAKSLGFDQKGICIVVMQLVRLVREGKEVKMSKRTGSYVTLEELIKEVGLDVARFFFLTRSPNTHLSFDLDLAKKQSEKNPVYYIQYAHARICSIIDKAGSLKTSSRKIQLEHPSEISLAKLLIKLPEVVEDTGEDYQVQRLPQYALDLATVFHRFYRDCRVVSDDKNLTSSRLSLVLAVQIVLKNTLDLMGISAPEKM